MGPLRVYVTLIPDSSAGLCCNQGKALNPSAREGILIHSEKTFSEHLADENILHQRIEIRCNGAFVYSSMHTYYETGLQVQGMLNSRSIF